MEFHWDLILAGVVNFLLLVWIFRKGLGDQIVQQIEKRKKLMEKLKKADDEYKKMIEFARKESSLILAKAEEEKKNLIHNAHLQAEKEKNKLLQSAEVKAQAIEEEAKLHVGKMEKELQAERTSSVKSASKKLVKRLLNENKELGDTYFDAILEDLKR